ncbi:MAG TPA: ABC transporter permease [Vicinamibacterales bacterium]|nr:ABC transporter permease [Vicinamibacterales bacterium]
MPERGLARWLPRTVRDEIFLPARQDLRVAALSGRRPAHSRIGYGAAVFRLWLDCWRVFLVDLLPTSSPGPLMLTFATHLRQAARLLIRQPLFTTAAVLTLALGVGANAAVFAVVEAVLLRPLPYPAADELAILHHRDERTGFTKDYIAIGDFLDLAARQRSFSMLAAYNGGLATITGQGEPLRVRALSAGPGLLEMLGVRAVHGRTIDERDTRPGAARVAMLGHELWQTSFAGDETILGRRIRIGNVESEVVGIAPPGFGFPETARLGIIVPLILPPSAPAQRKSEWVFGAGRLARGGDVDSATVELETISAQLEREFAEQNQGSRYYATTLRDTLVGDTRRPLLLLLGAVGVVLLIACANVGNLLLARALGRRHEMALRVALGAGRGRLISQLLAESLVLSLAAGLVGVGAAYWGLPALVALVPPSVVAPGIRDVSINLGVLGVTVAVTIVTATIFSLVSALAVRSGHAGEQLTSSRVTVGAAARRSAAALVAIEIALAVVLLIGAGLILRSFAHLLATDPGFAPDRVLTMDVSLPADRYRTAEARAAFFAEGLEALRRLPGVGAAGAAVVTPLRGNNWTIGLVRADRPLPAGERPPDVGWQVASGGYFEAMQIPLRAGRLFQPTDGLGAAPVVIVSEAVAKQYFAGENPVGRRLRVNDGEAEIIGVVGDIRRASLTDRPRADLYLPFERLPGTSITLFVRSADSDPRALAPSMRQALRAMEPNLVVGETLSMNEIRSQSLASTTFALWLLGLFAAIALALAAIGVYGVMSYAVRQRTREIGTRIALGATERDIVWLVIRQGGVMAIAGLATGLTIGWFAARSLTTRLHGVTPSDPRTLAGAAGLLAAASILACYLPARRAARLDAAKTLAQSYN